MSGKITMVMAGLMLSLITACSASGNSGGTSTPTSTPASTPSQTATPSGGGVPGATPGSIDPCSLLMQAEAQNLAGDAVGPGTSKVLENGDRECQFLKGVGLLSVTVLLVQAQDPTAAKNFYEAHK